MRVNLRGIARDFQSIGRDFYYRGWVLGTSGNFSAVISPKPLALAITASAASKGALSARDVLVVNADGTPVRRTPMRPSAETLLHIAIVGSRRAGAVLHTHSVWSTILSERYAPARGIELTGLEMLKGLQGVRTHEHVEWLPILDNDQDMQALAAEVKRTLREHPAAHGFLLRGHGLYTWGDDLAQARRHVEIFEFLLEATGRLHSQ
jgi:methylthioribulose-1-phosphate dehydratase